MKRKKNDNKSTVDAVSPFISFSILLIFKTFDRFDSSINSCDRFLTSFSCFPNIDRSIAVHFISFVARCRHHCHLESKPCFSSSSLLLLFFLCFGHTFRALAQPRIRHISTYYFFFQNAININISDSIFSFFHLPSCALK